MDDKIKDEIIKAIIEKFKDSTFKIEFI